MAEHTEMLRFERPPVFAVSLAVLFDKIADLKVTSVSDLISQFREKFPSVEERFPRESWTDEPWILGTTLADEGEPSSESSEVVESESTYPFPWLTFSDGDGHTISFQDDRLEIEWRFNEENSYPGFVALKQELSKRLRQLDDIVRLQSSSSLELRRVRLQYDNNLEGGSPLQTAALAHGLTPPTGNPFADWTQAYSAFNLVVQFDDADVLIVSGSGASPTPFLGIRAEAKRGRSSIELDSVLESAHRRLITAFDRVTTGAQKEYWGIVR